MFEVIRPYKDADITQKDVTDGPQEGPIQVQFPGLIIQIYKTKLATDSFDEAIRLLQAAKILL